MRKLLLKMSMSLDAFVAGPNGELDWIFKTSDAESTAWTVDKISKAGMHIMGSKTFHDMAAFWPTSTQPFAPPMNNIPKGVFTQKGFSGADPSRVTRAVADALKDRAEKGENTTATPAGARSWAHPRVFNGDLATEIRQLKQEDGAPIIAHGGAGFAQNLVATGLVDEFLLLVHPVALGKGLPLFGRLTQRISLCLSEIRSFPAGTVAHSYRPD